MTAQPAKKPGRLAETRQAYNAIKSLDPRLGWWMLGAAVLTLLVVVGIGWLLGHPWLSLITALPAAALAASLVMNQRGNKAMYGAIKGQPGATGATLTSMGRRGWFASEEPVAMDVTHGTKLNDLTGTAMVFRAVGRPGVVLLGEGPRARVDRLLKTEEKKIARVVPNVPVHRWVVGDGEGEVPVEKVTNKLTRMRPELTKEEVVAVNKRLRALGGMRPPIPAGIDPRSVQKTSRKSLRGK